MPFMPHSVVSVILSMAKMYVYFILYLVQSKYTKKSIHEIPSIGRNVLELFCVPLHTEFSSDLYKKFQAASIYDTKTKC